MTLQKLVLPSAVKVDGNFFEVHTEHPYWLTFASLLGDLKTSFIDFSFMFVSKVPKDSKKAFFALYDFYLNKSILPRATSDVSDSEIALDYEIDAELIYSAFMEQYKIDLFDTPIHWHKFKALLNGLHDTKLNKVIEYRLYKKPGKNDTYENQMQKLKNAWKIETQEEKKEKEELEKFSKLLKKNT